MDIEEVAHSTPEKIITIFVDPLVGLTQAQGEELAKGIGMPADSTAQFIDICQKLYKCYMDTDASLVEINPLNRDSKGNVVALDRSEEHTSELQSHLNLVCRLLLE